MTTWTSAATLIIDDEPSIRLLLQEWLNAQSMTSVYTAGTVAEAIEILQARHIDLLLVDLFLGEGSGLDVIRAANRLQPHSVAILITAHPTVETAISALQSGTFDYLVKPFRLDMLSAAVRRALDHCRLMQENMQLHQQVAVYELNRAVGTVLDTDQIVQLVAQTVMRECAAQAASVLLRHPETGIMELCLIEGDRTILESPVYERFLKGEGPAGMPELMSGRAVILRDGTGDLFNPARQERICQPLAVKGQVVGSLNIVRSSNAGPCGDGTLRTIEMIAQQAAIAIDNSRLYRDLQSSYIATVTALANAIEIRDPYTHGHTDRVKVLARAIGVRLGWDEKRLADLWIGCTLHDIGKIGVPDRILSKPGPLSPDEFAVMKTHPEIGAKIIEGVPFLKSAIPYVYYHHERFNGTGYPSRAAGEDIPIEGRLLAVVDAFDAITSDRPYRRGQSVAAAREELRLFSGVQFDPMIVDIFLSVLDANEFPWIMPQHESAISIP